ncbi:ABC transporter substrate-binding protein [Brucellaceae bacterium D45D]
MRLLALLLLSSLSFINATQARMVTDHDGTRVEVPDRPQRIVSLHDWTLTVMAYELGAPVIGSSGRMAKDGSFYMRGARELFGLDFTGIALASVHGKPDLERIRALQPDLIVANSGDYSALHTQLATIAPTLMFNAEQGRPMLELYEEFAAWIGYSQRFEELHASYIEASKAARECLATKRDDKTTYAAILANGRDGSLQVLKDYGSLTTVLDDLGFARMPIIATMPENRSRITIGAEMIDAIDADYIVTSFLPDHEEGPQSIFQDFERIAPGAKDFLHAFRNNHVLSFSRYEVYPPSFKGLNITIDKFCELRKIYR